MKYEHKDNNGSLFKNDEKLTENHPNARGSAKIDGVEYWVSAWTKKDKNGNPWQSLSFTKKQHQSEEPEKPEEPKVRQVVNPGGQKRFEDLMEDVPF